MSDEKKRNTKRSGKGEREGRKGGGEGGERERRPKSPDALRDQVVLGRALRELREARGLTQGAVAERMKKFATEVGRLERGERGARWHSVRMFLGALEASSEEFGAAIDRQEKVMRRGCG